MEISLVLVVLISLIFLLFGFFEKRFFLNPDQIAIEANSDKELYYQMVEQIEDYAIFRLDINGIVKSWNKGAEIVKKYNRKEIVNKNISIFYIHQTFLLFKHFEP